MNHEEMTGDAIFQLAVEDVKRLKEENSALEAEVERLKRLTDARYKQSRDLESKNRLKAGVERLRDMGHDLNNKLLKEKIKNWALVDALKTLVYECGSYGPKDRREYLKMGPMLEPSEEAVLNGRKALERNGEG